MHRILLILCPLGPAAGYGKFAAAAYAVSPSPRAVVDSLLLPLPLPPTAASGAAPTTAGASTASAAGTAAGAAVSAF